MACELPSQQSLQC